MAHYCKDFCNANTNKICVKQCDECLNIHIDTVINKFLCEHCLAFKHKKFMSIEVNICNKCWLELRYSDE